MFKIYQGKAKYLIGRWICSAKKSDRYFEWLKREVETQKCLRAYKTVLFKLIWLLNKNERWTLPKNHTKLQRSRCVPQGPSKNDGWTTLTITWNIWELTSIQSTWMEKINPKRHIHQTRPALVGRRDGKRVVNMVRYVNWIVLYVIEHHFKFYYQHILRKIRYIVTKA